MLDVTRSSPSGGITADLSGALIAITLDRVARLNAVDRTMRQALAAVFSKHARDPQVYAAVLKSAHDRVFSVGGDVRELLAEARRAPEAARQWIGEECELIWQADCFTRPLVSMIDGPVMGTGAGLAMVGTHQAAGENYRFQMPETAIGYFPDVGMAHTFARLPGEIGSYLGLTGRAIGRADAFWLGLVSHCIPAQQFGEIETELADAQPIDPALDSRHQHPGPAPLQAYQGVIDACFSAPSVAEVVERLAASESEQAWCADVRGELAARSPLALEVTLRHIRLARGLDLRQTLIVDHRIGCGLVAAHDFPVGVKAVLIDKSAAPGWQPARPADVTAAMVADVMNPVNVPGLMLPTRQEMAAGAG